MSFMFDPEKLQGHLCVYTVDSWKLVLTYDFRVRLYKAWKPYEYFNHLLTELPQHTEDKNRDFLADLLPWSEKLPEYIRKPKGADQK